MKIHQFLAAVVLAVAVAGCGVTVNPPAEPVIELTRPSQDDSLSSSSSDRTSPGAEFFSDVETEFLEGMEYLDPSLVGTFDDQHAVDLGWGFCDDITTFGVIPAAEHLMSRGDYHFTQVVGAAAITVLCPEHRAEFERAAGTA